MYEPKTDRVAKVKAEMLQYMAEGLSENKEWSDIQQEVKKKWHYSIKRIENLATKKEALAVLNERAAAANAAA